MIHYTCDRCKRQINPEEQTRFIVHIDIQSAADDTIVETDDDIDHLAELHQMLEGMHDGEVGDPDDEMASSHHGQYDLCPECHRQFLKNP
ncbi:MAG: hypothetical protein AAGG48_05135, partial [Planctomycetota bacterium]